MVQLRQTLLLFRYASGICTRSVPQVGACDTQEYDADTLVVDVDVVNVDVLDVEVVEVA